MPLGEIKVKSDDIVTVPEAAKRLGKPKMTLYRWIDADKIVSIRLGGILFIPVSEVESLKATGASSREANKDKLISVRAFIPESEIERLNKKKEQAAEA